MSDRSGGAVLAESLSRLGVKHVFALHGGHLDAFLVACPDHDIQLIDTRHEASAGHAAEAYARATGSVGVAVITAGPGFTNALTPMVSAYLDALPVLFIAGAPPMREVATNPLQGGFDQVAMATPACKWAHRITNGERIPDLVDKAIRTASSGRPGPVFLEVPIDVMFAPVGDVMLPLSARSAAATRPAPPPAAVDEILDMLAGAERPVIVAGGGTILSRGTAAALAAFAERTGIPVVTTSRAHGLLHQDHPCYAGGTGAVSGALVAGTAPDVVVLAGARQGLFTGGRGGAIVPAAARLIQIDVDGSEIGRLRAPDVAVVADCAETFAALSGSADARSWPDLRSWVETLKSCRNGLAALFESAPVETRPGRLHPYHAAKAAVSALPPETAVVCDGGESSGWCDPHLRPPGPGLFMTNGYLGCLGFGEGAAIGIATAEPGRPVAIFTGDGAAGFHIGELDTMVRHRLPIVMVVLNNGCWGMSQHGQDLVYGRNRRSIVDLADSHYEQVAIGFGCHGERVDRYDDIGPAIERALAAGRPACINLIIDADVVHPVTIAMVGAVDTPEEIAVPYYENIPAHEHS